MDVLKFSDTIDKLISERHFLLDLPTQACPAAATPVVETGRTHFGIIDPARKDFLANVRIPFSRPYDPAEGSAAGQKAAALRSMMPRCVAHPHSQAGKIPAYRPRELPRAFSKDIARETGSLIPQKCRIYGIQKEWYRGRCHNSQGFVSRSDIVQRQFQRSLRS